MRVKCELENSEKHVSVVSDYNSEFVKEAKRLGGKWSGPAWIFDIRDLIDVKALCAKHYGYAEGGVVETVDLEITWPDGGSIHTGSVTYSGITIARATGRDSGAQVAEAIKIIKGGFGSGGSAKNWSTEVEEGTRILIRDIPKSLFKEKCGDAVARVVGGSVEVDVDVLEAEREGLIHRLAEIDALLKEVAN